MNKFKLDLEDLAVETFATVPVPEGGGTVEGFWDGFGEEPPGTELSYLQSGCWSCASWCDTKCGSCGCAD